MASVDAGPPRRQSVAGAPADRRTSVIGDGLGGEDGAAPTFRKTHASRSSVAQIEGYAPSGHQRKGSQGSFSYQPNAPSPFSTPLQKHDANDPIERLRRGSAVVEDQIEALAQPVKPYVPAIGRFLIVVTFLEDSLRILTQWTDQLYYIQRHRHFPWGLSHLFLLINVATMLSCSTLIIAKKWPERAAAGLFAVVLMQGFGYGLIFDLNFFLRNLSVVGGLLMVVSESLSKRKDLFAGLPSISEEDRKQYFQLAGRVLLIFLFIGFVFNGKFSIIRLLVSLVGLGACTMVAVGFKARSSAFFLVMVLSFFNLFVNTHPQRDFLKYDFFQTLSVVGGLLLLVNLGAGGISLESKKRS